MVLCSHSCLLSCCFLFPSLYVGALLVVQKIVNPTALDGIMWLNSSTDIDFIFIFYFCCQLFWCIVWYKRTNGDINTKGVFHLTNSVVVLKLFMPLTKVQLWQKNSSSQRGKQPATFFFNTLHEIIPAMWWGKKKKPNKLFSDFKLLFLFASLFWTLFFGSLYVLSPAYRLWCQNFVPLQIVTQRTNAKETDISSSGRSLRILWEENSYQVKSALSICTHVTCSSNCEK